MDSSKESPDMSPVDKDGDKSESIFQPTDEKTDEEKTKRLTSAEETAPTTIGQSLQLAANGGQNEEEDKETPDEKTQPSVEDIVTDTEMPSVDECMKKTDSKCDKVEDALSNNVEVQIKTTNNSDEDSSVAVENSSNLKNDDENIIFPNEPNLASSDCLSEMRCDEESTASQLSDTKCKVDKAISPKEKGKEEKVTAESSDMKYEEDKIFSQSPDKGIDEKNPSSSERKCDADETLNPSSSSAGKFSEEKAPSPRSEGKCDEEKTPSSPSEREFDEERNPSPLSDEKCDEEKTSNPSSKRKCDDEETVKPSLLSAEKCNEEKTPSTSSDKKHADEKTLNPNPLCERKFDDIRTPSSPSRIECDEEKTLSSSDRKCSEEKTLTPSFEIKLNDERTLSSPSRIECDIEKTPSSSSDKVCDRGNSLSSSFERKYDEGKTPSSPSERKCVEDETVIQTSENEFDGEKTSSLPSESKCDKENSSSSPSGGKCDEEKTPILLSEGKCDEVKTTSSPSERKCDKEISRSSPSERKCDEEKTTSLPSERKCDDENSSSSPSEGKCGEENAIPCPLSEKECAKEINTSSSSDRKSEEEKTPILLFEGKCDEEKTTSSPSERKCDEEATATSQSETDSCSLFERKCTDDLSQSSEMKFKEDEFASHSTPSVEPANSFTKDDSCSEKVCPVVSNICEKTDSSSIEELKQTEYSSDVRLESSEELIGANVNDENRDTMCSWKDGELVIDETSQESTASWKNCENVKITENVCQLLEECSKTEVDVVKTEQIHETKIDDSSTNRNNLVSTIDPDFIADSYCTLARKVDEQNLLEVSNSENEPCENREIANSKKSFQNEIDESSKSESEMSQNKIDDSSKSDVSTSECVEDMNLVKDVSNNLTEPGSSTDLVNEKVDKGEISQNKIDGSSKPDIKISEDKTIVKDDVSNNSTEINNSSSDLVIGKVDESKMSQNIIDDSSKADIKITECVEDDNILKEDVSNNSTEHVSSADLFNKKVDDNDVIEVSQNTNKETSSSDAEVSKFDDEVNVMKTGIYTSKEQPLSSAPNHSELNTKIELNVTLPIVNNIKETTSIEKSYNIDESLMCNEVLDSSVDNQNEKIDCKASSDVSDNSCEETSLNLEYKQEVGKKDPQSANEKSIHPCSSTSNLNEDVTSVKSDTVSSIQPLSVGDSQSTSDQKVDLNASINGVADDNESTECVKIGDESHNTIVLTTKSDENYQSEIKSENSSQQPESSADIQSKLNEKLESNNVVHSNEKTGEIDETFDRGKVLENVNEDSIKTDALTPQPSEVQNNIMCDLSSSADIQSTLLKKSDTDGSSAVASENLEIPSNDEEKKEISEKIVNVAKNTKDSSCQSNEEFRGEISKLGAMPMLNSDIQSTINTNIPSATTVNNMTAPDFKRKRKTVVNRGLSTQNFHEVCDKSLAARNSLLMNRPCIASTSKCVGTFSLDKDTIKLLKKPVPVKVSKGTTTDLLPEFTPKPLFLSKKDVQRISEMRPSSPQLVAYPNQLHKNLCIIKTSTPGCSTQVSEKIAKGSKPKKVSIDCQVDESELTPIDSFKVGPNLNATQFNARESSHMIDNGKGSVATNTNNSNNQIVVTVRGTFPNTTDPPVPPTIPVQTDNSKDSNSSKSKEQISEAVKFFFQGATNLDKFFASNPGQQTPGESAKTCPNMSSVNEQWQACLELERNGTPISRSKVVKTFSEGTKKKAVPDKRKFQPILPKPANMSSSGVVLGTCQKLDGHLGLVNKFPEGSNVSTDKLQTTTLVTSCGEVKISVPTYALEGGSKLQQVVDKLYLAQESSMPDDNTLQTLLKQNETGETSSVGQQAKMTKQVHPTNDMLTHLKLPSNLTVIPQTVKKRKSKVGTVAQTMLPSNDNVEGNVFARLKKLGTVIEVERDGTEKIITPGDNSLTVSRSETSSPSATPNATATGTQPDYAQCLRVLDNLTQAGQILASIKKVNPKTAAKSKSILKPLPNLKKIEVPAPVNKQNLQRRSSLPSDAIHRSSPVLPEETIRPETSLEVSRGNLNENEHCLKIASNPELTIIHKKLTQGPPAAKTPPPSGIECPPLPKILQFEQQLNCPPTISITTEESGSRKETTEPINTFVFRLDVSQVREKSSGERVLNCDICSAEYPKVASLKRHYLRKHINVRYISAQDKQNYLAPSKNKNGAESSIQKSEEDESMKGLYKCSTCRKCFDEKNDLKNHLFEQHILGSVEFKTFDCSKCSNTFDNIKEFVAHRKICSQQPAPPPPPISHHFCLYCEQSFVSIAARNKHHYKAHHCKKKYQKCFICDSDKYRDKSSLFKHMLTQHKSKYFGCEACHFRFGTKADLDRHNHVKHGLKKGSKKAKQSVTSDGEEVKPTTVENNKSEDSQLPSVSSRLENETTEVVEKVESQTKPTKNVNTEVNSKYELAKMLVRVGPQQNATESEMQDKIVVVDKNETVDKKETVDKSVDSKAKNDSKTKAGNKKKPEPKPSNDNKSKSETKDVNEEGKSESKPDDKVVENKAKVENKKKSAVTNNAANKCNICGKVFGSAVNLSRHDRLAHGHHPRRKLPMQKVKISQKMNVFTSSETADGSELTLLYNIYDSTATSADQENNPNSFTRNVKENLLHHLDGKLDSQEVMEHDLKSRSVASPKRRLSFSASFSSSEHSLEGVTKESEDSKDQLPISPKSSIEKYNFPKNYDGCGGLTSYFKDMSHLDLFTQKAMRFTPQVCFENGEATAGEYTDIHACLELVKTDRSEQDDGPFVEVEFSGEWTRPRRYICAVCNFCTGELWEIEDHKLALHPNVWCPHHEVLVEEAESWQVVYRKRRLKAKGVLGGKAVVHPSTSASQLRCTKCNKVSSALPDFHRHMLDCGGDTTWSITMLGVSSPGNRRNRKWRPFGSRRRRQQGRRGLKRNIPNTPAKPPGMKVRSKPGDMETIQRMIANLPAKRVSRRVFGDDNEVKTRSQGTISSGSIYSTPFTYQFNNKAALAKKQAAKLIKSKMVSNGSLNVSPKKDEKKLKSISETSEKPQSGKTSPAKESSAELPQKKSKSPDKNKSETHEKKSDVNIQGKNPLKRDHSKVDKSITPEKEDNSKEHDVKKKQKVKHNVFTVKEESAVKNIDKTIVSGKNKSQIVDSNLSATLTIEANKNETAVLLASVSTSSRPAKSANKPIKQDTDKQKRSSDDFRKSLDDFRKRMCIDGNLIMCSGCGTQFDNSSACQRHMKKCSYCTGKAASGLTCSQCNTSFTSESLKQEHVCDSITDDRAMPKLSPEEPYPDQAPAAVEDIPVLSPEEIGKNKSDDNSDLPRKSRLTRSESKLSIVDAVKKEKVSSEEDKPLVMTRNSRSGLRQKTSNELNKSQDETEKSNLNKLELNNKPVERVLRYRSITNLSSPDDDDNSKTTDAKSNEPDVSGKNQQKLSAKTSGRKRPHDEDDNVADNDRDDSESSVKRESRRGQIINKNINQESSAPGSELDSEIKSNENRRKSMRLSVSTESEKKTDESEKSERSLRKNEESQIKTEKKLPLDFLKETSQTGERQGKRFLCEVCDKVIMEIYLKKHVEGGAHMRNVEMRSDFDNLFPNPEKFSASCSTCDRSFSSPFMSYKHQLHNHEDSLMELIESSMIEPLEKEIKVEADDIKVEVDDVDDVKTKQKFMSRNASEENQNLKPDCSTINVSETKIDCNKLKQNDDGPSMKNEKTSKGKSLKMNSPIDNENGKCRKGIASSSKDSTEDKTEKRLLRARRDSLPNDSTEKSGDNLKIEKDMKTDLPSSREGKKSSARRDSSVGKTKEVVEKSGESVSLSSSKSELTVNCEDSSAINSDLQLRGRKSLTSVGSSANKDVKDDVNHTQITKTSIENSLSSSTEDSSKKPFNEKSISASVEDSSGKYGDSPIKDTASSKQNIAVDAPPSESAEQEDVIEHDVSEFNQDGKVMKYCAICDRAVGRSAYKKHSNSAYHKRNMKFRKEFNENYADSTVATCKACHMDFNCPYSCFKHSMEVHPEAVVLMFDSHKKTPITSSKQEKKTPTLPFQVPSATGKNSVDPKKTVQTISTPKEVVQTTMFDFLKKTPTSPNEQISNTTTKKSTSAASSNTVKHNTLPDLHKMNVEVSKNTSDSNLTNDILIPPPQVVKTNSCFDFINETITPILSYREVTQNTWQRKDNQKKIVASSTVATKDVKSATFDSNQKTKNLISSVKEAPKVDSAEKNNTPSCSNDVSQNDKNEKTVIRKVSPNEEMAPKTPPVSTLSTQKTDDPTPVAIPKEIQCDVNNPDKEDIESVRKSDGSLLKTAPTLEVKPFNTLFCATCHKRVKIESLRKHSASSSHIVNCDQSNFVYEVPADCDRCQIFESFPFACRAHQKSVLKSKKKLRKISDDDLVKSLLGKMSKKKFNKLKKRQKLRQSEKLAETKINRLKKMKINNWQVSVVKKVEDEKCVKTQTSSTVTSEQVESAVPSRSSEFDCLLCSKQFSSALLLVEHQNTRTHKLNESRNAIQTSQQPKLSFSLTPPLHKTSPLQIKIPLPSPPQPQQEIENNFGYLEPTTSISNANNASPDQDLTQVAGEAILAYGWQDQDWSTVRSLSGWDNQSVAGSSSSGIPDTNMTAFWETDINSSFMGGRSSLGSILDSVNKILTDPDIALDPNYRLTELQSEVGEYHDDMSMLHKLGERSNFLQDVGMRTETSASNASSVQDNWSYPPSVEDGSTTLMDLDNQHPTPPPAPVGLLQSAPVPTDEKLISATDTSFDSSVPDANSDESKEQLHKRLNLSTDVGQDKHSGSRAERSKRKHSDDSEGSSSRSRAKRLHIDYESRETICPSCGKHFLGLTAVQTHLSSCSNIGGKSGGTLSWLKRRALLNTPCSFDSSLVCHVCKEILSSPELLRSHVSEYHTKREPVDSDAKPKSENNDPVNKEGAEKLKSKMSIALGTLLDKALTNLLGTKNQDPELNTGAIQLLGKLCAVRRKSQQKLESSTASTARNSSTSASATATTVGGSSSQTVFDRRNINLKEKARLRSLIVADPKLPKLPWLVGASASGGGSSSNSQTHQTPVYKPVLLPSPNTLVDHLALMLADGKPEANTYACPVCSEKFPIPSARNNHLYEEHQDRKPPRPTPNAEERSEKDWRGRPIASSSCDSDFGSENGKGESSDHRPICSDCGLSFANMGECLNHRREVHNYPTSGSLPVSENIVDSTSGDENRGVGRKSKRMGGGGRGGGEKTLPALEPIGAAERLRKRPLRKSSSQEEKAETEEDNEEEEDDCDDEESAFRRKAIRNAKRMSVLAAPEEVRVKAEAALRELSQQKSIPPKEKPSASCKYGSYRYSKHFISSSDTSENAAMMKARFASIVDKKWKMPGIEGSELAARSARRSVDGLENLDEKTAAIGRTSRLSSDHEQDAKLEPDVLPLDPPPE